MDEAFLPLHGVIGGMRPTGDVRDEEQGLHLYISRVEIEAPVEVDVSRDDGGTVQIGTTPPLYYIDTSLRPSYHRLRFVAELDGEPDAGN
jgi:hypothetical protein